MGLQGSKKSSEDKITRHPPGGVAPEERRDGMKKVMFNEDTNEFYGDYGNGMIAISQDECYCFVNSKGVKCLGDENGYAIYGYR